MDVRMASTSRKRATTVYTMDNSKIENQIENAILKNKTIRKELKRSMKIDNLGTHFDP